jgi:hypothetical protein
MKKLLVLTTLALATFAALGVTPVEPATTPAPPGFCEMFPNFPGCK